MNTTAIIGVTSSLGQPVAKPPHLHPRFAPCSGQKQITITAGPPVVWDPRSKLKHDPSPLTDTHRNSVAQFNWPTMIKLRQIADAIPDLVGPVESEIQPVEQYAAEGQAIGN